MVADGMAFLHHPLYQIRGGGYVVAHQEKGGGRIVFFQCIQDGRCISVFVAGVKGEVDHLFAGFVDVVGVVGFQRFRRGIGYRGLSVFREA